MSQPHEVDILDRCSGCGHSLDRHFRAESRRVVCLVTQSGVSTSGVIGLPWSHGCDCIDGHSPEADARRAQERKEREKRDRWVEDIRKQVAQTTTGERPMMRAKIRINSVQHSETQDTISGAPVASSPYDAEGNSEDNTFARYTPSGSLSLTINNPALVGKIQQGDVFYVDFTKAE